MTREEEIKQAALEYSNCSSEWYNDVSYIGESTAWDDAHSFKDGAKWADEHPICPWVSIKEHLPEESKEEKGWSIEVYVRNEYGGTTAACYNYKRKEWHLTYGEIEGDFLIHTDMTHWMPIPELKKGDTE